MAKEEKKIYVYENWSAITPRLMGLLYVSESRGSEVYSFEYNEDYLRSAPPITIDPDLELYSGRQYAYKSLISVFSPIPHRTDGDEP